LTVCGERNSCSAISRLVEPAAISPNTSRSRSLSSGAGCSVVGANIVIPRPTILTARATSRASRSLVTNPDAPAARAAAGDIRPAPEIRSTRVEGDALRIESHTSAPDSAARNRSTSATCGLRLSSSPSASAPVRAARQRSTQGCSPSRTRKPQCTTSWSSTTSTRRRRSAARPVRAEAGPVRVRSGPPEPPAGPASVLRPGPRTPPPRRAGGPRTPPGAGPSRRRGHRPRRRRCGPRA